jgi:hypothetical protein
MDVQLPQDGASSQLDTSTSLSGDLAPQETAAPSITELDKLERFRYQGKEWTPKDLEKAILRQEDYTRKTQTLAEERKAIESARSEQRFYENLYADLNLVKQNPQLAAEFIKVYPQKFHQMLKQVVQETGSTQATQSQGQNPYIDVEARSELQQLRSILHEQEVAKSKVEIESQISNLTKKYPDAIPELVIGRVYEAYNQQLAQDPNAKLSAQVWEDTFKAVNDEIKRMVQTKYGDLVKKQTSANAKGKDVGSGGGTPTTAPRKFKKLSDVKDFMIQDLSGRGN